MNKNLRINGNSSWAKRPKWQKRLHGFATYLLFAFAALLFPEEADAAMYDGLKGQFTETPNA